MTATVPVISFKIELCRKEDKSTFHRFSGSYTYSELNSVITHLWGERPKELQLSYTDDEGDVVRLGSQEEWEECVRIFQAGGAPVLRLTAKRMKDEKKKESKKNRRATTQEGSTTNNFAQMIEETLNAAATTVAGAVHRGDESDSSDSDSESEKKSAMRHLGDLPDLTRRAVQQPLDLATPLVDLLTQMGSTISESAASFAAPKEEKKDEEKKQTVEVDANKAVVDLMSIMYNCDASVELFRGATDKFGSVVKRIVNPFVPEEVHLDIDRTKLYRQVTVMGNQLIDSKNYEGAERLLRNALVVFPDSMIHEYNLACVKSLQGFVNEAIDLLVAAKNHGYDDVEQLRTDPDLENARKEARFATEVCPVPVHEPEVPEVPEPEPVVVETPAPVVVEPVAPVAPAPAAPVAPAAVPENPQVLTLLSIFPHLTMEEASKALIGAKGNLAVACNTLMQ